MTADELGLEIDDAVLGGADGRDLSSSVRDDTSAGHLPDTRDEDSAAPGAASASSKKKWVKLGIVGAAALALVVGLAAGLGSNNDARTVSASQANNMDLEMCLEQERAARCSKSSKSGSKGSKGDMSYSKSAKSNSNYVPDNDQGGLVPGDDNFEELGTPAPSPQGTTTVAKEAYSGGNFVRRALGGSRAAQQRSGEAPVLGRGERKLETCGEILERYYGSKGSKSGSPSEGKSGKAGDMSYSAKSGKAGSNMSYSKAGKSGNAPTISKAGKSGDMSYYSKGGKGNGCEDMSMGSKSTKRTSKSSKPPVGPPTPPPTEPPPCVAPGFCTCPADVAFTPLANDVDADRLTSVSNCDDFNCVEDVTLPFNWLNVADVTEVSVNSNGFISVTRGGAAIDILFADLDPGNSPADSGIYNKTNADGSFTISFEGVGFFNIGTSVLGAVFAQATLFADGRVNLCYDGTGSIPGSTSAASRLQDIVSSQNYPNPLEDAAGNPYFGANGLWTGSANNDEHPDGCACFYPGTPP